MLCATRYLREIAWMDSTRDANRITEFFVGEDVSLTVLALSPYNSCLFAGTSPLPRVCLYM